MFNVLSLIFRYIFIIIIYLFILAIIRLIYLDIKSMYSIDKEVGSYLKLINRKEMIPYKIKEEYVLKEEITIGRGTQNDIVLKDPYVSKEHAKVVEDEGKYFLEDLDSANGTYLNNEKVLDVTILKNGDRIKLGQIEFLFVL